MIHCKFIMCILSTVKCCGFLFFYSINHLHIIRNNVWHWAIQIVTSDASDLKFECDYDDKSDDKLSVKGSHGIALCKTFLTTWIQPKQTITIEWCVMLLAFFSLNFMCVCVCFIFKESCKHLNCGPRSRPMGLNICMFSIIATAC